MSERCPRCDQVFGTDPTQCAAWTCKAPAVDWRTRALRAERSASRWKRAAARYRRLLRDSEATVRECLEDARAEHRQMRVESDLRSRIIAEQAKVRGLVAAVEVWWNAPGRIPQEAAGRALKRIADSTGADR